MFGNLLRPSGREFRITPSHFEKMAGRPNGPLKSPCATGLRRATARLHRRALGDGYAIHRDDFRQGIIPCSTKLKNPVLPDRAPNQKHQETTLTAQPVFAVALEPVGQATKPRNLLGWPPIQVRNLASTSRQCNSLRVLWGCSHER